MGVNMTSPPPRLGVGISTVNHSINEGDYGYYIGVQSKESEAACNIVSYSIIPV